MKKKYKIITIISVIIGLLVFLINAGNFLVINDKPEKSDVIVVLSGDSGARTECGVRLLKKGLGDYILFSGGVVYNDVTMADLMKNHAINLGIKEDRILIENQSQSTYENAIFSKEVIEKHNFKSAIIVTSDYHTRRTKPIFQKAFKNTGIKLTFFAAKDKDFNQKAWWKNSKSIMITINEYIKIVGYFVKGLL